MRFYSLFPAAAMRFLRLRFGHNYGNFVLL